MNKTVNINLANILFHIDEDAYNKMRRYLESITRSFANTPGSDEIIADIEARIAELFHEKLENERQVITTKEVDDVIAIMGQPEDYIVDEDIFEDEPNTSKSSSATKRVKKLYRDIEHKYIGGVCAGLEHYIGIDSLWIRLLLVLLTVFSWGGFILIYGLLWILIPEAKTTSQQLDMRGETVNISNIERKVKEGFDEVAEKVKNVDYEKVGNKVKNGSKTFFDTLGDIIMFLFKVFGKFIGILLIIIGATVVIALFIGLLTIGTLDWANLPWVDNFILNSTIAPTWLVSLITFFAVGIPFFFLFYLGLKILVTNLKSIGNVAKFSLLGLWLIAIISLIIIGVKEAAAHAYSGSTTTENQIYIEKPSDTLNIALNSTNMFYNSGNIHRVDNMIVTHNNKGEQILLSDDVRFHIKKAKDSIIKIEIRKEANGPSYNEARENADKIEYNYKIEGNTLLLNNYFTLSEISRFKDEEMHINIYVPAKMLVNYNKGDNSCWKMRADNNRDMNGCDIAKYTWLMSKKGKLICQDCPDKEIENDDNKININKEGINIKINENGEKGKIIIDENGIDIDVNDNGDSFKMKINEDGIKINADEN